MFGGVRFFQIGGIDVSGGECDEVFCQARCIQMGMQCLQSFGTLGMRASCVVFLKVGMLN